MRWLRRWWLGLGLASSGGKLPYGLHEYAVDRVISRRRQLYASLDTKRFTKILLHGSVPSRVTRSGAEIVNTLTEDPRGSTLLASFLREYARDGFLRMTSNLSGVGVYLLTGKQKTPSSVSWAILRQLRITSPLYAYTLDVYRDVAIETGRLKNGIL